MIRTLILLAIALPSISLGHVCLKLGMEAVGEFSFNQVQTWPAYLGRVLTTPLIYCGVLGHAIFFTLLLIILSDKSTPLSFVMPLTSMEYLLTALWARIILAERISVLRLTGTMVVCVGVFLICLDGFRQ